MSSVRIPGVFPRSPFPQVCVWEITRACNARCSHCGSSAGPPRARELTRDRALRLVGELADLGCECLALSGGEPLLREDWPALAASARAHGLKVELITNGLLVGAQARAIAEAHFESVSFSIDGPHRVHDRLRGVADGLNRLLVGARALREKGVRIGAVTQVNLANLDHLEATHELLVSHGFEGWQVQLTLPYGRAALDPELCLRLRHLSRLESILLGIFARTPLFVQAADTIGYMSRSEPRLRAGSRRAHRVWGGCQAGLRTLGITSDGAVRGCLSLPAEFDEGNLQERSLRELWRDPGAFAYRRQFDPERLSGPCATCAYRRICGGGCTALAWVATRTTGENPWCLRRPTDQDPTHRGD